MQPHDNQAAWDFAGAWGLWRESGFTRECPRMNTDGGDGGLLEDS
jgi:hypothetical protein